MSVIVTGAPRSGTRRLASALSNTKLVHTRHEQDGTDVTVSCLLAIDVDDYRGSHVPYWDRAESEIWHLVRHPFDCIPSLAERVPHGFWIWQHEHTGLHPRTFNSRREFASQFWVRWNEEAEARGPVWRFKIEELEEKWEELWERLGRTETPIFDERGDNYKGRARDEAARGPRQRLSRDELKSWGITIHDKVCRLAEKYDYEVT